MQVTYRKQALKDLRRMQAKTATAFQRAFRKLADDPQRQDLDVKKLQGREGYRLRIGGYRAIFTMDRKIEIIDVLAIANRGDAY
jgi:mRNA interferase RelE/StbE